MKKLLVFLVLILHVNTSMFIPVMDEMDLYDEYGNQLGDINSLVQLIDEFFLGHTNRPHVDPDDDQAHFFNVFHHIHPYILQKNILPEQPVIVTVFGEHKQQHPIPAANDRLLTAYDEVIGPPPEC